MEKIHKIEVEGFQDDIASEVISLLRGKDGEDGKDGRDGIDGKNGKDGIDGKSGKNGKDGKNGINGINGLDGINGKDGKDGSPDTAVEIRNKLETLEADERLDAKFIKNSATLEDINNLSLDLSNRFSRIPQGSSQIEIFNSAGKVGSGTAIKFIGSGVGNITNDGHTTIVTINDSQDLSGYVPYTGATSNVDLGAYKLTSSGLTITSTNIGGENTADSTGRINLNSYQRAEDPNNFGEVTRIYSRHARSKQMIAWYDAFQTGTCTLSSSTWTATSHYLTDTYRVVLSTTDALPSGFSVGTTDEYGNTTGVVYYVVGKTTNTFQLSATKGGAAISGSGGSGTHTFTIVPQLKVWAGYHYLPNDVSDTLTPHEHWSVEVNDANGLIQTRFEVMATNANTTQVNTFNSNFTVIQGVLGVTGAEGQNKQIVIYKAGVDRNKTARWSLIGNSTSESGGNTGTDFKISRFDDSGAFIDSPFFIKRSTGYIGIGDTTTSPSATVHIIENGGTATGIRSDRYGTGASFLQFKRAGGTLASPTAVVAENVLGKVKFEGCYDTSGNFQVDSAYIQAVATQTFSASAGGTRLEFAYTANGATTPTIGAILRETGDFLIGTSTSSGRLTVKGSGATSATTTLSVQNSTGSNNALVVLDDGRTGHLTSAPTHTITLGSGSNGIATYNTADQTVNYERNVQQFSGNIFQMFNTNAGTGTLRGLQIGDASDYYEVIGSASGGNPKFAIRRTATTTASGLLITNASGYTGSSGTQYSLSLVNTINQTSTAGFTDLLINRTETALGSGTQAFIDLQVAGSSKFKVDNAGRVINTNVVRLKGYTVAGLPAGTVGDTAYVTDALAPTLLNTVVGGGAVTCTVFYNGANWVVQ